MNLLTQKKSGSPDRILKVFCCTTHPKLQDEAHKIFLLPASGTEQTLLLLEVSQVVKMLVIVGLLCEAPRGMELHGQISLWYRMVFEITILAVPKILAIFAFCGESFRKPMGSHTVGQKIRFWI